MSRAEVLGITGFWAKCPGDALPRLARVFFAIARPWFTAVEGGPTRTDEELFARHQGGDREAFDQIFCRYSGPLMRFMRRQVRSPQDAADLVQQTFLQLHRARRDFREGALLRPWLYTIALNLRREYFRRRARRPEMVEQLQEPEDRSTPEDALKHSRLALSVRAALADLPEGQRLVIELHWFEGASFPDIASMLGVGLSAVKVRAHRGYGSLRKTLVPPPGLSEEAG